MSALGLGRRLLGGVLLGLVLAGGAPAWAQPAGVTGPPSTAPEGLDEPAASAPLTDPDTIEAVTSEVSSGLRCPVCQGMSVDDSPAEGARTMKARIRELVTLGYNRQQIEDYFVDRYGTWILLAPPAEGRNWTVYVAPVGFVVLGLGAIGLALRRKVLVVPDADGATPPGTEPAPAGTAASLATGAAVATPPPALSAEGEAELDSYRRQILAELGLDRPAEAT